MLKSARNILFFAHTDCKDQGIDQAQRRHQGVYKGGHVALGQEHIVRRLGHGVRSIVGDGNDLGPPLVGEVDGPDGAPGVPGEGQANGHIPLAHLDNLVKDLLVGALPHVDHVVKHQAEVKGQEPCQGPGGPGAQDVNLLRVDNGVHRCLETVPVNLLHGHANLFHVRLHHGADHVRVAYDIVAHLNALDRGEFVPNHLLQGFLHGGIAVILQL